MHTKGTLSSDHTPTGFNRKTSASVKNTEPNTNIYKISAQADYSCRRPPLLSCTFVGLLNWHQASRCPVSKSTKSTTLKHTLVGKHFFIQVCVVWNYRGSVSDKQEQLAFVQQDHFGWKQWNVSNLTWQKVSKNSLTSTSVGTVSFTTIAALRSIHTMHLVSRN